LRLLFLLLLIPGLAVAQWQQLEPGLELGYFKELVILRVDSDNFELKLLCAKNGESKSAKKWCKQSGAVAAINASMFQQDGKTSVSLMKSGSYINNNYISKDNTILAFNCNNDTVPEFKIIDKTCDDFVKVSKNYNTVVQNIRMISCRGNNVWSQQKRKHSVSAIGIDKKDRILLIYSWYAYSTHDLISILKQLPIDIEQAVYTEGGPLAQLYVENADKLHDRGWSIPNVIAVMRKEK
jgi:hypothetical protein